MDARRGDPPRGPQISTGTIVVLGTILFVLLIVIVAVFTQSQIDEWRKAPPASTTTAYTPVRTIDIGEDGELDNGTPVVVLGVTIDAYDEVMKAGRARDDYGKDALFRLGLAFTLPAGTRIRVIDTTPLMSRVRVTHGREAGKAGWIPFEYVKRRDPMRTD